MTRSPLELSARRAALLVAALAITAGCSANALSGPPSHTDGTTSSAPVKRSAPPPLPAAPQVGECRQLVYSAISRYSNSDPTVPCQKPHSAYTFAVESLPPSVSVAGASIGNTSIQDAASASCRGAFAAYVGGDSATRALSRLSVTYFLPQQKDFNRGASWIRCDVVALKTANSLALLPKQLSGVLDDPASIREFGVCSQGVPGAAATALVMCTEQHTYRALTTIRLGPDSAPYPGEAVAGKGGQKLCSSYLETTLGPSGGYTFGWTYPTLSDWAAGQRFGYCWQQTNH